MKRANLLVVIYTVCIGSYKSNYYTITTTDPLFVLGYQKSVLFLYCSGRDPMVVGLATACAISPHQWAIITKIVSPNPAHCTRYNIM
jgi:hypothetical protein